MIRGVSVEAMGGCRFGAGYKSPVFGDEADTRPRDDRAGDATPGDGAADGTRGLASGSATGPRCRHPPRTQPVGVGDPVAALAYRSPARVRENRSVSPSRLTESSV